MHDNKRYAMRGGKQRALTWERRTSSGGVCDTREKGKACAGEEAIVHHLHDINGSGAIYPIPYRSTPSSVSSTGFQVFLLASLRG
jgi:hypothetical protein